MPVPAALPLRSVVLMSTTAGSTLSAIAAAVDPGAGVAPLCVGTGAVRATCGLLDDGVPNSAPPTSKPKAAHSRDTTTTTAVARVRRGGRRWGSPAGSNGGRGRAGGGGHWSAHGGSANGSYGGELGISTCIGRKDAVKSCVCAVQPV